jgi:tRNA(Arg) A34 adenosine deaminase TadA
MRLAIDVARENVSRGTGGPFGAAIFEAESGRLIAVGMNSVVRYNNCTLHGEMVAFMMAQQRVGSFTLKAPNMPVHELHTTGEPCAMCLGATLWSGVRRVVCGAAREDAARLNFEEGRCFPSRTRYLEARDSDRAERYAVMDAKAERFTTDDRGNGGRAAASLDPVATREARAACAKRISFASRYRRERFAAGSH